MNASPSRSTHRFEPDSPDVHADFCRLRGHLEERVLGQPELVERLLLCLLSDGHLLVEGAPGLAKTTGFVRLLEYAAGGGLALAVLAALAAGLGVGRRLLARVGAMRATMLRIVAGRRGERMQLGSPPDEFDALAEQFNRLLDDNDQLLARVREVTDDVAHDLCTPLARMRGHVEAALAAPELEAPARDWLHDLLEEIDRLLAVFNALLRIAQIENRASGDALEVVDLNAQVRDALDLYQPLAEEAGFELGAEMENGPSRVRGDRHLVAQALGNLIDNALKYSSGPGRIAIGVRSDPEGAELWVIDAGPGIPAGERERVLQRFVRLDAARLKPGTGLGLSFVAAVADFHGALLRLEDAAPGLRVGLRFPPEPPARQSTSLETAPRTPAA